MTDEEIEQVVITSEEDNSVIVQEEEETAVVDNGQTYESTESAIIARDEARKAKLWAEESERQANLSSESALDAANSRDIAESAKEVAQESAETAEFYAKNIKFGMVKELFTTSDWVQENNIYYIEYNYNIVSGVYKQNQTNYELMTNIDVKDLGDKVRIYSIERFAGFVLLVNSAENSVRWGNIGGDLTVQTDLQNALNLKANASDIPTKTSDLTNDSGFITSAALVGYATVSYVDTGLNGKQDQLTQTQLDAVNSGANQSNIAQITANQSNINNINSIIPAQASSSNQLADKDFVNSSIATNTATFRGTFNSVAELEAYSGEKDNNDYAFVTGVDSLGNTYFDNYVYNGTAWAYRWRLNNSSFTAAQWASINSGATTQSINQISTNTANISSLQTSKQDVISDLATIRSGAALGATAIQPSDLATVATSGSYNDLSNKPTIPAAQVNSDWNATSGVAQILNKPTIPTVPTNVSAFTNDAGYITSSALNGYATETYVDNGLATKQDVLTSENAGTDISITTGTQDVLLSGVSPLALTDALELNYIKALGATEQNGTPTPSNPVDIVCNNGVLKIREKENLFDVDSSAYEQGKYWNSNGVLINSNTYYGSNVISVVEGKTYSRTATGANANYFRLSDNSVVNVSSGETTVTAPESAIEYFFNVKNDISPTDVKVFEGTFPSTEIYADGTQETVTVVGNLFDKNTVVRGYRLSNRLNKQYSVSDDFAGTTGSFVSALIPVEVGKTYYKNAPSEDAYHRYKIYNTNQVGVRLVDENTVTIQEGEAYIAFCGYLSELDNTILYDTTNVQTANAEMLLEVGNNQDNQELLTGNVTRNIGIKVFDGTENWEKNQSLNIFILNILEKRTGKVATLCSHYAYSADAQATISDKKYGQSKDNTNVFFRDDDYTTVNAWKQYLAEQYANGTPVIFVYPLATSTTETVSGQTLTASGNCTVTATGSLNNLELEANYKSGTGVPLISFSNTTGYATQAWVGQQGYITGITSSDVTTALGYTPYNSSNPSGYITSSALTGYEQTSNKVTSISSSSTDTEYPTAKCVYDIVGDIETLINAL